MNVVTLDLEEMLPAEPIIEYDIVDNLHEGLVLKEKSFRDFVKSNDWSEYAGKHVGIICSNDAIVPTWAFMLLASALEPHAESVHLGSISDVEKALLQKAVDKMDLSELEDRRVIVKGCSDKHIDNSFYVGLTTLLQPVVKSLMFGEPCSTVPVYRKQD